MKDPQLEARNAEDPERASLAELRREHGRDIDAWPAKARDRYRAWETKQLAAKAERDALSEPTLPDAAPEEPLPPKRGRRG